MIKDGSSGIELWAKYLQGWNKSLRHIETTGVSGLPAKLWFKWDNSGMVEAVFAICSLFGVCFEGRHMALELFERVLAKEYNGVNISALLASRNSRIDNGLFTLQEQFILRRLLACVQLASKLTYAPTCIMAKHITTHFPEISVADAFKSECEVLNILDFRIYSGRNLRGLSIVLCLESLLDVLDDTGMTDQKKLLPATRKALDILMMCRWSIFKNMYRIHSDKQKVERSDMKEEISDPVFLSAGAIAAATYISIAADTATVVHLLERATRIKASMIGSLAQAIVREASDQSN